MTVHSRKLWTIAMARLACVLAGVGLVTTRLGLVAHELIGHGGTALALGGEVDRVRLFWFAGGWIHFALPRPTSMFDRIAVALGGIALEFVVGLAVWIACARRTSLAGKVARATGGAIVLHAAWYLAVGTYHGFGDGAIVRHAAGDGRYVIAIAAGLVVLGFAYASARAIIGVLAATIPGTRRAQLAGVVVAAVLAGGVQAALAIGEVRVRDDQTYGTVMRPERVRVVAQELARWEREQARRGLAIDAAARHAREVQLAARHRELPFAVILGVLALLAIAVGAWRARPGTVDAIPRRFLVTVTACAVASVALVIALDAVFA